MLHRESGYYKTELSSRIMSLLPAADFAKYAVLRNG